MGLVVRIGPNVEYAFAGAPLPQRHYRVVEPPARFVGEHSRLGYARQLQVRPHVRTHTGPDGSQVDELVHADAEYALAVRLSGGEAGMPQLWAFVTPLRRHGRLS